MLAVRVDWCGLLLPDGHYPKVYVLAFGMRTTDTLPHIYRIHTVGNAYCGQQRVIDPLPEGRPRTAAYIFIYIYISRYVHHQFPLNYAITQLRLVSDTSFVFLLRKDKLPCLPMYIYIYLLKNSISNLLAKSRTEERLQFPSSYLKWCVNTSLISHVWNSLLNR